MRQYLIDKGDGVIVSRSFALREENIEATVLGVRGIRARVQYANNVVEIVLYTSLTKVYSQHMNNIASFFIALAETIRRIERGEWDKETIEPCRLENLPAWHSFRIHPMHEDEHSGYIRHKPGHRNALRVEQFGPSPWEIIRCDLRPKHWETVKMRDYILTRNASLFRTVYDDFNMCISDLPCNECPVAKRQYSAHGNPSNLEG